MSTVTSKRIFSLYQSRRAMQRRGEFTNTPGSHINNVLSSVAHTLNITMEQARQGYIEGYAHKHGVSIEQSAARLADQKQSRANKHETGCSDNHGYMAYACATNYA